jgi:hypothetical protein
MAITPVSYEAFDEDPPSHIPSYIMSAFVLVAVFGLAFHGVPAWPPSLGHLFMVVWFGILFRWMLLNARERRLFLSDRLTVTNEVFRHSFRYAVSEATHVEIPVAEIEEVRVSADEPRRIEVIGKSDGDLYFLPRGADVDELVAALTAANPAIRVTRD